MHDTQKKSKGELIFMTTRYLMCLLGLIFIATGAQAQTILLVSEINHSALPCLKLKLKALTENKKQAVILDGLSNDHPLLEAQFASYVTRIKNISGQQNLNIKYEKRFYGLEPHNVYTLRGLAAFAFQIVVDIKILENYELEAAFAPQDENPAWSAIRSIKSTINDEATILETLMVQNEAALKLFQSITGQPTFIIPRLSLAESAESLDQLKKSVTFILGQYIEKLHEQFSQEDEDLRLTPEDQRYIEEKRILKNLDPYLLKFHTYNEYLANRYLEKYIAGLVRSIASTKKLNDVVIFSGRAHVESLKKGLANLEKINIIHDVCK